MSSRYTKSAATCRELGLDKRTLRKWGDEGGISFIEVLGQRHYDIASITVHANSAIANPTPVDSLRGVDVVYGRVSTRKQRPNLDRQLERLTNKYPDCTVLSDCASGLNFQRKGLKKILQLAFARRLRTVHIAYKDRLCRFGYELIEFVLKEHGANIVVDEHDEDAATPERELADDVLSIITVFGARLHGKRSGGNRTARKQEEGQVGDQSSDSDADRAIGHGCEAQEEADPVHAEGAAGRLLTHVQDQDASDS